MCNKVTPIEVESKRVCAVRVDLGGSVVLLVCVYMPCDDRCIYGNLEHFYECLNDIDMLLNDVLIDYAIIGGDFNTDLDRASPQTQTLQNFMHDRRLEFCISKPCSTIDYTFCSKATGARSLIDHFVVSENFTSNINSYESLDNVDNFSDHIAIRCVFNDLITYGSDNSDDDFTKVAWSRASHADLELYKERLDYYLSLIIIPDEAVLCREPMCNRHKEVINGIYDNIVDAMTKASDESIPANRGRTNKCVPGWNEYVDKFFKSSLFWHNLWRENGEPETGILADIRRKTRSQYHQAHKMVKHNEGVIRSENLANYLTNGSINEFWENIRKINSKKNKYPLNVDGVTGENNIANLFVDKFSKLYNSVSFNDRDMVCLQRDINNSLLQPCTCANCDNDLCQQISPVEVAEARSTLKLGKSDGNLILSSEHFIHASFNLNILLSILFSLMLRHGVTPEGMLIGTMVPIPKGRWANLCVSDNYRAITLSSILLKLFDKIIMEREKLQIMTSNFQFSFKTETSTSVCTGLVQETISYYNYYKTNVYMLLLDVSKAFDRVNYVKLFRKLRNRNVCPYICRLLLEMYIKQKLRVRWRQELSDLFNISNGVKQGGVLSPTLFCIYIDELLIQLEASNVGCYMGGTFAGAFAYADDLTLLSPSVEALNTMIEICNNYASEYDIIFNASKSKIMVYSYDQSIVPINNINMNGVNIEIVNSVVHLGHALTNDIRRADVTKCIQDFNRQCNLFFTNFKFASSDIKNYLFHKYCSSFYGSQILPLYDASMQAVYRAWRVAVRRVWKIPWTTHCILLPHLAQTMSIELCFAKRTIHFLSNLESSNNPVTRTIYNMAKIGSYSVMGGNIRHLTAKYNMSEVVVYNKFKEICSLQENEKRISEQIKELCVLRDKGNWILPREDLVFIINQLCTE